MIKNIDLKNIVIETLDLNKAHDIISIDLKDKSSIADYMIIASGTSSRHIQSLSEQVLEKLKDNGMIYGFVPYLYKYHAPMDLKYQDYFRFSKDTLAYLFKDFNYVELFPLRGRLSSALHMLFGNKWKKYIEKTKINLFLDKFIKDEINHKQCSGFYFVIKK